MAVPIGKLTILVGADLFEVLKRDDSTPSVSKPHYDTLTAQVNSLHKELQILTSSQPLMIVTTNGEGTQRYGVIVVVLVAGYAYVWWKVSDLRGKTDAFGSDIRSVHHAVRTLASPSISSRPAIDTSKETPTSSSSLALKQPPVPSRPVTPSRAGSSLPVFASEAMFSDPNDSRKHVNGLSEPQWLKT